MLVSFRPLWASLELPKALRKPSERPPGTRSETRPDPEPSPKRNPPFSHNKTTNLEDLGGHVGIPNKPQPPPPVELFFDSASYTSSVKAPTRRAPRVGGFRGPAATCADPGKKVATQRLLRSNLKVIEINGFRAFCWEK